MPQPKTGLFGKRKIHYSVGALIINKKNQILLIDRVNPPFGWAGPAGHIDDNETPEQAISREVSEESGLKLVRCNLLFDEFIEWNKCNRGVKGHYWYLFDCTVSGELISNNREAKSMGWYNVKTVKPLEPVWEYWFKKLGLL